jgi:hypothetical protein
MRTIAASRLGSTDLVLAILHLFALPLCHDCSLNQVLECREGMIHQLILQRVNQASQETILSLGVGVHIFRSIARQLQKFFSGNGVGVGMGGEIRLPPRLGCSS